MDETAKVTLAFFQTNVPYVGQRDLLLMTPGTHDSVLYASVRLLLLARTKSPEAFAFPQVYVVVPPGVRLANQAALGSLATEIGVEANRLAFRTARDRSALALAEAVAACPAKSAVVCVFAELYGSGRIVESIPDTTVESVTGERVRQHSAERLLAHELNCTAEALRDHPSVADRYVLCVSAGGPWRHDGGAVGLLAAFHAVNAAADTRPDPLARLDEWTAAVRAGVDETTLRDRVAASGVAASRVSEVVAVALYRGGRPAAAYELVRRVIDRSSEPDAAYLVMAARMAIDAGRWIDAKTLVNRVCEDEHAPAAALRVAAETARALEDLDLAERTAHRLVELVPADVEGAVFYADVLTRTGRFDAAIAVLARHRERLSLEGRYLHALASYEAGGRAGGVSALVRAAPKELAQRAVAAAIFAAAKARAWDEVDAALALAAGESHTPDLVQAVCRAIRVWALRAAPDDLERDQPVVRWCKSALELLARNAGDARNRLELEEVLGASVLGELLGLACLLPNLESPATLDAAASCPELSPGTAKDTEAFLAALNRYVARTPAPTLAPKALVGEEGVDLEVLQAGGLATLAHAFDVERFDDDDVTCVLLVTICLLDVACTRRSTVAAEGAALAVSITHFAATGLAMRGRLQRARDLIETALYIAAGSDDAGVMADAWLAFADVALRSHRCGEDCSRSRSLRACFQPILDAARAFTATPHERSERSALSTWRSGTPRPCTASLRAMQPPATCARCKRCAGRWFWRVPLGGDKSPPSTSSSR